MSDSGFNTPKKLTKHLSPIRISKTGRSLQRSFVPPVLQEVGKLAAGVAAVATGSATGNPRNKHALQPGHSLMDWIRLGSSGKDLTGFGAQAGQLTITPRQLAQHDKPNDAWIAIRGKVYNVTHYLPFHPGGQGELMRGIGKDATTLFDEVHAWVNYESLLQKCYLGRLVMIDPETDTHQLFFGKSDDLSKSKKTIPPKILPPNKVTPVNSQEDEDEPKPIPKFDWIQKTDYITLIFYTGSLSNPEVEINPPNAANTLNIGLVYDRQVFSNEVTFFKEIQWPCQVKINYETGKIEAQFRKLEGAIWETYGSLKQKTDFVPIRITDERCKYTIVNKLAVNYDTFLLELERLDQTKLTVPIGKHIRVFLTVQGQDLSRSYTPIPNVLVKLKSQVFIGDKLCLMIKSYPNGALSKYICGKKKGDVLELSDSLGSFCLKNIENRETFLLLAAGTGITPILGVLLFLLERRIRRCKNVTLIFFNKTENDILLRQQLETLQNEDNRLHVEHVLSQSDSKWSGLKGKITNELLRDNINKHLTNTVYKESDIFTYVCGPAPFTNLAQSLLTGIGFNEEQIHLFLG
ncbi:hypothetical protein RI129_010458 [Pyrocoelia pectoralis]|uniref:Cytochrome b5 reductase 4 n=1 Tax=Pyrocoelia pectoralis TaxID=417401 RepID=A0AAN7VBB5_9COLE